MVLEEQAVRCSGHRRPTFILASANTAAPTCVVHEGDERIDVAFAAIAANYFRALDDAEALARNSACEE